MVDVEKIEDKATLKQVATLLIAENARLHKRLEELSNELSELKGEDGRKQLELEITRLKEQMSTFQQRLFGDSSEKRPRDKEPKDKKPRKGHGPREQPNLPVIDQVHELDEEERVCTSCGGVLDAWDGQFEESEEVTVVERKFVIHKHKRTKYRCKCGGCVKTADGPRKLIPGGRYSVELAVDVAISKYQDHLPLERQAGIMRREGLFIDSQTLWDQIDALARHLEPSHRALPVLLHEEPLLHADETTWKLLGSRRGKTWYVWSMACRDKVYYRILPSRSAKAAAQMLTGYEGVLMVDGYKAYKSLARASPKKLLLAYCWAHVRRKFVEAEKFYPEQCGKMLDWIGQLYAVEQEVPEPLETENAMEWAHAQVLRKRARDEKSRPIVAEIKQWAMSQTGLPKSQLRKAIEYMLGLWPGLVRFLDDPRIPLDNNLVERALRGAVIGRKNHYGSKSLRGTEVAAVFYSLIETAKLRGIEPRAYLLTAANAAIDKRGAVTLPSDPE